MLQLPYDRAGLQGEIEEDLLEERLLDTAEGQKEMLDAQVPVLPLFRLLDGSGQYLPDLFRKVILVIT